jgi:hypothetical protein
MTHLKVLSRPIGKIFIASRTLFLPELSLFSHPLKKCDATMPLLADMLTLCRP